MTRPTKSIPIRKKAALILDWSVDTMCKLKEKEVQERLRKEEAQLGKVKLIDPNLLIYVTNY